MTVTSETVRLTKCCHEQLLSVTTFLLGFFYFVRFSFLFTRKKKKKKKKELRQRLLSVAHALYVRLLVALVFSFTLPFCRGFVVLSKVFVFRYYRVVCPYYWRGGSSWNLPSSHT